MVYSFRNAKATELPDIWTIMQQAIAKRKNDGSQQWQDGYPNPEIIKEDIEKHSAFVLVTNNSIAGYVSIAISNEPAYNNIEGQWLTHNDYVVFHRLAIAKQYLGKGLGKKIMAYIEKYALQNNVLSIKADTNFDNSAMLSLFEKYGYTYCGKVFFRNSPRNAYEKTLKKQ